MNSEILAAMAELFEVLEKEIRKTKKNLVQAGLKGDGKRFRELLDHLRYLKNAHKRAVDIF